MVIDYEPTDLADKLSFRALTDIASVSLPTIVGAWMTRIHVLAAGGGRGRRTADVDIHVDSSETVGSQEMVARLRELGYVRDTDPRYPFRLTRQTSDGAQIVDLIVDSTRRAESIGFPVVGLDSLASETAQFELTQGDQPGSQVRVPVLERAFLLRCLALADGPGGLKFSDYAFDALQLAGLVERDAAAGRRLHSALREEIGARAAQIASPWFRSTADPGARATASRATGDPERAALEAVATMRRLLS